MSTSASPLTVADLFANAAGTFADSRCLWAGSHWLTFADVQNRAARAVSALRYYGAERGDRVILALENSALFRILEQAVLSAGLVRVAVTPRLHPEEIAAIAVDADAAVVCVDPAAKDRVSAAAARLGWRGRSIGCADSDAEWSLHILHDFPASETAPRPEPDDLAMLMYSSGTTGTPKAATVTHAAWVAQTQRALSALPPMSDSDTVLAVAPMAHFGGTISLNCASAGAATVPIARFDPTRLLTEIRRRRATVVPLVPVMLARLAAASAASHLDTQAGTRSLRAIPYGGSPIAPDALTLATEQFPDVLHQFYGLAEALAPLSVLTPDDHRRASAAAQPGSAEAERAHRILTSAGSWLPGTDAVIDAGELRVRGPVVSHGYWRRPGLTNETFAAGWFRSGDIAEFSDGYLRILGRLKETIITGGYNVYPGEVESALAGVAGVADLAVVGLPHPEWGEGVNVAVVLSEHGTQLYSARDGSIRHAELLDALVAAARLKLAGYKKPVAVHVLEAIPRNAYGKVDRVALRRHVSSDGPNERLSALDRNTLI